LVQGDHPKIPGGIRVCSSCLRGWVLLSRGTMTIFGDTSFQCVVNDW